MDANLLIEASAGTGKTQALAERLIELLRLGVKPQEIVALTFSRAAAGEIFERFVSLLADRAQRDPQCAVLLREVIATQHLSQIGTLDSFLMRIVRSFPLELGLCGDLEMMDDYRAGVERSRTSFSILRRTDKATKKAFVEAFALAMNRENVRSFVKSYHKFIASWHEHVLAHPAAGAWGDASVIWRKPPEQVTATEAEVKAAAERVKAAAGADKALADFAQWADGFRGSFDGMKGLAKKFFEKEDLFAGATIDVSFNRRQLTYGGEQAAAIRNAVLTVCGYVLRLKLELARGVYTLISIYEKEYAKKVRAAGRLVFADVPRLIAGLPEEQRLGLEYRMDAKIRAWALDEFQDTSREQWKAMRPLIDEAKQSDGDKSVFIVGDRKQAIYGWRNGDVGIFTHERESGAYATGELSRTYRSGPAVIEAVNRIFVDGRMKDEFPTWSSPVHQTARPGLGGYVQRVDAAGTKAEDFVAPVFDALKAVDPVGRHLSAAVLVRSNTLGELLAAELKGLGLKGVVWEGESAIYDTPALGGFLDLVALADHPGDTQSYRHFRTTPLAKAKYPEGVPPAAEVSAWAAAAFTSRGLVRVFRELRSLFPEDPEQAWSVFTEERFTDFLRAASEFELAMEPGVRLSDFASYLESKVKRNVAEPGKIKIMTIHRSKGLGFDYVVLPLYEHEALTAEADGPLESADWVLPDPGARVTKCIAGLTEARAARKDKVEQEALCIYYVAMTRAKRAMTIITQPPPKTATESIRFSDLVRASMPEEIGDREWYLHVLPAEADGSRPLPSPELPPYVRQPRVRVTRRLPSVNFHSGMSAGSLFARQGRQAAAARGTAVHAAFERILWVDPAAPQSDLERRVLANGWEAAFVKPSPDAQLWREQSFEILADGRWTSGQIDRVVFTGTGADRRAAIYDFKTNAMRRGESAEAFAVRMRETYASQMFAYRQAVSKLTELPPESITLTLLLVSTGSSLAY